MKRILIGLIALAVLAAGGWFGFNLYARHRATAEIEAVFDRIRSQGGKASHGKVAFDLTSRTLTIEDIAVDPAGQPQAHVKIAGIKGRASARPMRPALRPTASRSPVSRLRWTKSAPGS